MSQPLSEYFAREAGDFLDELDTLVAAPDAPDAERFFRVARGVRGSAQLAGAEGVARVAERLEDAARSVRDGVLPWSDEVRGRVRDTSTDLRILVRSHGSWSGADQERADDAVARWSGTGEHRPRAGEGAPGGELLEFVRREIGGVVSEVDRAVADLRESPEGREPLRAVLRRMRPVRGVAGMRALAPVLEVLEGIEDTAHETFGRAAAVGSAVLDLLGAGRDALRHAAELLASGAALDALPGLDRFRELRDRVDVEDEADAGIIPISQLFFDDGGPHIVSSPSAPVVDAGGDGLRDDVEAFLRIEATGFLDRAEALIAGMPDQPRRRFGRIARQLAELASSVRELAGTYGMGEIAAAAGSASDRLRAAGSVEEARAALRTLRASLPGAAPLEVEPEPPAAEPAPAEPAPAIAADEDGVVPIEALLYDPHDALQEALRLRARIEALVGPSERTGRPLGDLLDELFGLVELGLRGRAA
jgi:HPt (histidine-containing phosphotransfer) domain-containing protein